MSTYKSYCGTCGHHMYYEASKCPSCSSSYIKKTAAAVCKFCNGHRYIEICADIGPKIACPECAPRAK